MTCHVTCQNAGGYPRILYAVVCYYFSIIIINIIVNYYYILLYSLWFSPTAIGGALSRDKKLSDHIHWK